jgi:PilZ domain-containing protein
MSAFPALPELPCYAPGGTERRRHRRYPIVLGVQYRVTRGRAERLGSGTTLDVSRRGVLFRADDSLLAGSYVELTMEWPFLWKGVHPLTLVMRGQVVRSDGNEVAVRTREHELRVANVSSEAVTITAV